MFLDGHLRVAVFVVEGDARNAAGGKFFAQIMFALPKNGVGSEKNLAVDAADNAVAAKNAATACDQSGKRTALIA